MTEQEVAAFLALPGKTLVRSMSWSMKDGNYTPPIWVFQSALQIGAASPEGVYVRAFYREAFVIEKGAAKIEAPDSMGVNLHIGNDLVFGVHTHVGQEHQNSPKIGAGRPYFGQLINAATHEHIWVGEYGYAEPLADLLLLEQVFARFFTETNIVGITYVDPMRGQQGRLI